MQAHIRNVQFVSATCFVLLGSLCGACGGARDVDFFAPAPSGLASSAGAPADMSASAGASSVAAGAASAGSASGGAVAVAVEPSMPAAGAASGGSGGAPVGPMPAMRSLVDDVEANVSSILEADGRAGYWYTFNDGEGGSQQPAPNGPFFPEVESGGFPGSTRARHTHGSAFASYAGFGFDLNNRSGQRLPYDASGYRGVVLWLRGSVPVRVLFPTRATAPTTQGGTCTSSCNDSFGMQLSPTSEWAEQAVSFATLEQLAPSAGTFDPKALLGVAFSVQPGTDFDVWVDEIGFY